MSSGESWVRGAGKPGSGQQPGDDEQPGDGEQPADGEPARRRARWRDLSPAALRTGSVPPPVEDLGEDAYWSYLRGDRERSSSGEDADQRDDGVGQRQPPPSAAEVWTTASMRTWSPRATVDGNAESPGGSATDGREAAGREAAGREAAGREAAGREAAGREAAGREAAAPWLDEPVPPLRLTPDPEPALAYDPEPALAYEPAPGPVRAEGAGSAPAADAEVDPGHDAEGALGHDAEVAPGRGPASGRASAGFPRRARVLPGIGWPLMWTAVVTLGWLAVVAYGVARLDLLWSLLAVAAGVGALALGLQGRSVVGLVPVLVGAAAWGMATGGEVPASPSDTVGDLQLIGLNSLYAVPLLIAYGLTTWLDAVGSARDRVRAAVADRRWWGSADVPDAEPGIGAFETIPSARFFQLPTGAYPHLVTAGRRVALVRAAVWPSGRYTVTEAGEVHRDGRGFAEGSGELRAAIVEARRWIERMGPAACSVTGFLVVHPASDRPGDAVHLDPPRPGGVQGVHLVSAAEFAARAGDYLAAEPYRLDVPLTERLGAYLPILGAPGPAAPASPEPPVGMTPSVAPEPPGA